MNDSRRTPAAGRTPTQREAERLEDLLERLGFEVELKPNPPAPLQRPRLPPPEPEPNVVSLELPPERPLRRDESQDDAAPLLVARRIKEAAARSGALTDADHAAFDARIRRPVTPRPARVSRGRLQEAVVWREVLGPPAALGGSQAMWDA